MTNENKVFLLFEMCLNYTMCLKGNYKHEAKKFFELWVKEGRRLHRIVMGNAKMQNRNSEDYIEEFAGTYGEAFDRICKLSHTQLLNLNDTLDALSENRITIKKKKDGK